METGRSPQPPRRRTRIHHPISSYVPFFVFLTTIVIIVLVIVLLVGRLLSMMPSGAHSVTPTATATPSTVAVKTVLPSPTVARRARPGPTRGPLPAATMPVVMFAPAHDPAGTPIGPSAVFTTTVPRIYAFARLQGVPAGAAVRFLWTYGPHQVTLNDVSEHHGGPAYPVHVFSSFYYPDRGPFAMGAYTVSVTLAGRPVARGSFRILKP